MIDIVIGWLTSDALTGAVIGVCLVIVLVVSVGLYCTRDR